MNPLLIIKRSSIKRISALLFFCVLFFLSGFSLHAREYDESSSGKITGTVIDSLSSRPMEYATVSLIRLDSNKVVNGTITNGKGEFSITDIESGSYKIVAAFLGYEQRESEKIVIDKSNLNVHLAPIRLADKAKRLKEVNVTAEKSLIENKIDKLVYNVDQDITSQTGVAADVLKKVPMVTVDVDGNVELLGNPSVRFLINGKPSVIFGNNLTDVLHSIPANQIQSIEVITSPGAKYEASGTGGIINIILKKNSAEGINGNVSLTAGTRLENGSFDLNAHHGHFGANAFFGGNGQLTSTTINTQDRRSQYADLTQRGTSKFSRGGFESGIGVEWDVTKNDNISASLAYDLFGSSNSGTNDRTTVLRDSSDVVSSIVNDRLITSSKYNNPSTEWELSYKRAFKNEDQELEVTCVSSTDDITSHYTQQQKYLSPDSVYSDSYGDNPGKEKETNISADYVHPLGEDFKIEAGARATIYKVNSISNVYSLNRLTDAYAFNPEESLTLNYTSHIYAGYLSANFKLFDELETKAGMRYEYTEQHAYYSNSGNLTLDPYGIWVPSVAFSREVKNHTTIKINYSHRIERPEYRDLNPFINASDPKNISTGNAHLVPETGDKIELGYNKTFKKGGSLIATLFYRGNRNDIQGFTAFYPSYTVGDSTYENVTVATRANIGKEDNYGLSMFGSLPVKSKLVVRTNVSLFQRYIVVGALQKKNVQGFNARLNLTATYSIDSSLTVELFGNYNSPRVNSQGTSPAFVTYNAALRKQFWHKNASVALTATNFFNQYVKQETKLTGDNFTLHNVRELPYQSFGINFTYKFGKLKFTEEKDKGTEDKNLTSPPEGN